jgi:hypothetical protein
MLKVLTHNYVFFPVLKIVRFSEKAMENLKNIPALTQIDKD